MSDDDVINVMGKLRDFGFSEVSHRTCFVCVSKTKSGGDQLLRLEIDDSGASAVAGLRYSCTTTDMETGTRKCGDSAESVERALANTMGQWSYLDS
jgi:hypothetical protein